MYNVFGWFTSDSMNGLLGCVVFNMFRCYMGSSLGVAVGTFFFFFARVG